MNSDGEKRSIPFWYGSPTRNVLSVVIVAIVFAAFFIGSGWKIGLLLVLVVILVSFVVYLIKRPR